MKKASWADNLSAVTRRIIVTCGILLVVTAVVTMLLMFFPIQKEDQPTVVVEPVRHTEYSATTRATTARTESTASTSHTLSTWNAGITGFNPDVNEHLGTQNPRYTTMDPRLVRKETTTLAPGKKPVTTTLAEGEIPFIMPRTTPRPETTTVTVTTEVTAPPMPDGYSDGEMTNPPVPPPMPD